MNPHLKAGLGAMGLFLGGWLVGLLVQKLYAAWKSR